MDIMVVYGMLLETNMSNLSEVPAEDHLIILHEFFTDNKAYAMSSSI